MEEIIVNVANHESARASGWRRKHLLFASLAQPIKHSLMSRQVRQPHCFQREAGASSQSPGPAQRQGLLEWRGWSLPSLQTLPWLCYSADMVEFPAWQGSICYTELGPHSSSSSLPSCFGSFCSLVPCSDGLQDLLSVLDSQPLHSLFWELIKQIWFLLFN